MKPRKYRIKINMEADVSDGTLAFDGNVSNVSLKGLMLRHVPRNIDFYSQKSIAIINGPGKKYKLLIKPRWSKILGNIRILDSRSYLPLGNGSDSSMSWIIEKSQFDQGNIEWRTL